MSNMGTRGILLNRFKVVCMCVGEGGWEVISGLFDSKPEVNGHNAHLNIQLWRKRKLRLSVFMSTNQTRSFMGGRGLFQKHFFL